MVCLYYFNWLLVFSDRWKKSLVTFIHFKFLVKNSTKLIKSIIFYGKEIGFLYVFV
ncbi:UNVERIFIED_CONTAM: hypothetical protein GTU68_028565 [Idotea baltica]|nr:hypothetical protein [Idotea baltica]